MEIVTSDFGNGWNRVCIDDLQIQYWKQEFMPGKVIPCTVEMGHWSQHLQSGHGNVIPTI